MFDEIPVMASRDLDMFLFSLFLWHHCLLVLLLVLSYHSILGSVLGYGPENVAQIPACWPNRALAWRLTHLAKGWRVL